jgi:ribosomal protein S18 acetylase RimI-like enzyme
MTAMHDVRIDQISDSAEIDSLRPLWLALHAHDVQLNGYDGFETDEVASWSARRTTYLDWFGRGDAVILVARAAERLAGYLVTHFIAGPDDTFRVGREYAELYSFYVEPAYRSAGLGSRLFDRMEDALRRRGVDALMLGVTVENTAARRFYERRGMHPVEMYYWRSRLPDGGA